MRVNIRALEIVHNTVNPKVSTYLFPYYLFSYVPLRLTKSKVTAIFVLFILVSFLTPQTV